MADTKITALTALTAADPANDVIPIVDVSDTSMAASGTTKKISVNNILGASGTATLASATITGDLTVDTSTLKVDSTNNRVGVNTASPANQLSVRNEGASAIAIIDVRGGIGGAGALQISGNGTTLGTTSFNFIQNGAGAFINNQDATPLAVFVNGSERYAISSSGVATWSNVGGTSGTAMTLNSTGNLAFPTGKGIDFSATPGTGTSELLNDYEEGTWTPVATGLTNVGAVTYNATYTKIGRVVYINLKVTAVTSTTSVANTTFFSGLPFTPALNSTITAVNEGNITSLGVGLIATGSTVFTPNWTAVQNATISGFYYV